MSRYISTLVLSLEVLKETADAIPPPAGPFVKGAVGGFLQVITIVKANKQNAEDIRQLNDRIKSLEQSILRPLKGRTSVPMPIVDLLTTFAESLSTTTAELEAISSRSGLTRFFRTRIDSATIQGQMQRISALIQDFLTEATVTIMLGVNENAVVLQQVHDEVVESTVVLQDDMNQVRDVVVENAVVLQHDINRGHNELVREVEDLRDDINLSNFRRADKAHFRCSDERKRRACLAGTRTDLLEKIIYPWIPRSTKDAFAERVATGPDSAPSSDQVKQNEPRIFLLTGVAGTGKSTIAQSVAEYCDNNGWLAASFFFSRDDDQRNQPKLVFSTIAHQLGTYSHPPLRPLMQAVVKADPYIWDYNPSDQLQKLIIKPIQESIAEGQSFPSPAVIVLDALDECEDNETASLLASVLSTHIDQLPFSIFLTSRPEFNIRIPFQSPALQPHTQPFILHEIAKQSVEHDIQTFLIRELTRVETGVVNLQSHGWLTENDIQSLVQLSDGLFIFAATAVRFIMGGRGQKGRLRHLISAMQVSKQPESSPFRYLDHLYLEILREAYPLNGSTEEELAALRRILGCIVLLRDPLSELSISVLLRSDMSEDLPVADVLAGLHSILIIPSDPNPIRVMHASFPDFAVDENRCTEPDFLIDPSTHHNHLTIDCLNQLNTLQRDICDIRDYTKFNYQIEDLSERIARNIPPVMQYACRHWADHLSSSSGSDRLFKMLEEFCFRRSLYWLEALSLLDSLDLAIPALRRAQKILSEFVGLPDGIVEMLYDLERFTFEFFNTITNASLHIYHSALPFSPLKCKIRAYFQHEIDIVVNGIEESWSSELRTMGGRLGMINAVAFSPDGTRTVTGGADRTVRIWDTSTGISLNILEGHSNQVNAVAFSLDDTRIVSGSSDNTVRIWDANTGTTISTLKGHSHYVSAVAFSPDGTRIGSGSWDNTVRIWDANTGSTINTLEGHSRWVGAVAFSPDGTRIVSGSKDITVRIWDVTTGTTVNILEGLSNWADINFLEPSSFWVCAVAFSLDGTRIVSGSNDGTVCIQDTNTGTTRILEGHSKMVSAVTISLDGMRIVSGSYDNTVRIWDASTGTTISILKGHSRMISAIATSLDGTRIVSGSADSTVRIWDSSPSITVNTLQGHSGMVRVTAFSPEGTRIASGSDDNTIRIWDASTGTAVSTLEGHSDTVCAVAFSPDGTRIVSAAWDNTVRIWDASTGTTVNTLEGHSSGVNTVAFSPDGKHIVSGSNNGTICIVDARNGTTTTTLKDNSSRVQAVAFLPDGMHIVADCCDYTVHILDANTGITVNTLKGHSGWVIAVGFSPDGTRIVSGSYDHTVRIWDAHTSITINTLEGHSHWVGAIAFSPDGTRIVSGSYDHTVRIWDVSTGTTVNTLKGHLDVVNTVTFSPDGTRIASGSYDHAVRIWDADTGITVSTLEGHSHQVSAVAFSPDGTRIISGSKDNTVRIWDASTGTTVNILKHSRGVDAVAFSPDGTCIVSVSTYNEVHIWDASAGTTIRILERPPKWVRTVAFSPNGAHIIFVSHDYVVRIWDAITGTTINIPQDDSNWVHPVCFSLDGLISGSEETVFRIWDASTGATVNTLKSGHSSGVSAVAFSLDGTRIVFGAWDHTARIWDASTGTTVNTLEGPSSLLRAVMSSSNGTSTVSGSYDNTFRNWGVGTGAAGGNSKEDRSPVAAIAKRRYFCDNKGRVFTTNGTHVTRLCSVPPLYIPDAQASTSSNLALCSRNGMIVLKFPPSDLHPST